MKPRGIKLEIKNLMSKQDGVFNGIFNGFSLTVDSGEICVLLGVSGCGKSTLISRILGLHEKQIDGEVLFDNLKLSKFLRDGSQIGLATQDTLIFPFWDIKRNIEFVFQMRGKSVKEPDNKFISTIIAVLGLDKECTATMSGGEQKRVGFARALCGEPKLLLLDEVFAGCDIVLQEKMCGLLIKRWKCLAKPTILLITHDVAIAARLATRCLVFRRQKKVLDIHYDKSYGSNCLDEDSDEYRSRRGELMDACHEAWKMGDT
jgi:ABC-type nitrate/sulfonate/bicarbonate transport system ATPase subunit